MTALASTLPQGSNDGYVAAAYIVFFAIVLIYVAIMAIRLGRVERRLGELRAQERDDRPGAGETPAEDTGAAAGRQTAGGTRERERV
jgi:hypothetical protein